jgi:hypothetical protein
MHAEIHRCIVLAPWTSLARRRRVVIREVGDQPSVFCRYERDGVVIKLVGPIDEHFERLSW